MIRKAICICCLWLATAFNGAFAAEVEVSVGAWQQSISGPLAYKALNVEDTIELDEDIDFDDEVKFLGRLKITSPSILPSFYVVVSPVDFEGSGSKSVSLKFGDTIFPADAQLDTEITLNQYDFALYYALPFVKIGSGGLLNIDVGVNARYVDLDVKIDDVDTGISEDQSLTAVVPMIYVGLQVMPTDWLAIEAEGRGIALGDSQLTSIIGRVKYKFIGTAFASAGYRIDNLDIDEEDVDADVDIDGPFIEFGINF